MKPFFIALDTFTSTLERQDFASSSTKQNDATILVDNEVSTRIDSSADKNYTDNEWCLERNRIYEHGIWQGQAYSATN